MDVWTLVIHFVFTTGIAASSTFTVEGECNKAVALKYAREHIVTTFDDGKIQNPEVLGDKFFSCIKRPKTTGPGPSWR